MFVLEFLFFQAEDGIRDLVRSRGLGDVYKRQGVDHAADGGLGRAVLVVDRDRDVAVSAGHVASQLGLEVLAADDERADAGRGQAPVSYTHLTLPPSDLV